MKFLYKYWKLFCQQLVQQGRISVPASDLMTGNAASPYVVLKHDVETDVSKALKIARIESEYGHRGSYYVQAYLLEKAENIAVLKQIQSLGHEVSYHYDVLDGAKGDMAMAKRLFQQNKELFESNGFPLTTVCQHGNPVVTREGYTSNRDFFRSPQIRMQYPEIADIMVNFKELANTDYSYFSDAGRRFSMIADPINNDVIPSDDQNILLDDLEQVIAYIAQKNAIISMHPHRWEASAVKYMFRDAFFKCVRFTARLLARIPLFKKLMSRYYYLAKKI